MIRLRLILNNEIDRKRTDWYVVIGNTLSSVAIMQLGIIIHNSLGANGCDISMNYKYYDPLSMKFPRKFQPRICGPKRI